MKNYIQQGDNIEVVAPVGGYTSGQMVKLGEMVGISYGSYAQGDIAVISLKGVYELPKMTGVNFTTGAKLYLLEAEGKVTNVASQGTPTVNNPFVGYAWKAAVNADTVAQVKLAH